MEVVLLATPQSLSVQRNEDINQLQKPVLPFPWNTFCRNWVMEGKVEGACSPAACRPSVLQLDDAPGIQGASILLLVKCTTIKPKSLLFENSENPVRNPEIFHKYVTTHGNPQNWSTTCTERVVSGSLTAARSYSACRGQRAAVAVGDTQLQSLKGTFFVGGGSNEQKCLQTLAIKSTQITINQSAIIIPNSMYNAFIQLIIKSHEVHFCQVFI